MQIEIERDQFSKGLQLVQSFVEPRQTLPILGHVLLDADGDSISMSATDLAVSARATVPARVSAPGALTLSARALGDIIKELPRASVSLRAADASRATLRCEGASFKLAALPAGDFPAMTVPEGADWLALEGAVLRDTLRRTSFAMSHDESRYALNGVFLGIHPDGVRAVATDGHRLAVATREMPGARASARGVVPRKAVQGALRALGGAETAEIALAETQFLLRLPTFLLVSRLIEGQFPDYERVVPRELPIRLTLSRAALSAAIRRVAVVSDQVSRPVVLHLRPGALQVAARSEAFGEAEETLGVEHSGEEIRIAFNARFLLEALEADEDDQVAVELKDGMSPALIRPSNAEHSLCVIMPMRV